MNLTARIVRRRLVWRLVAARKVLAKRPVGIIGSLFGVAASLVFLLALAPAAPLQFAPVLLRPAGLGIVRAEAAPPPRATPTGTPDATPDVTAMNTSTTDAVADAAPATSTAGDEDWFTPVAALFGAVQRAPTATPTTSPPAAKPSPTASPTASVTPSPTATPNPFANDTLTDISRIPGWQTINWAAYVPTPVAPAVPGVTGTGQFIMPTTGFISTPYSATHEAIDIAGPEGSAVIASDTGTIVFAGLDYGGFGYAVEIDHGNGFISAYGHNSVLKVKVGQIVRRGDLIALRGSTGHSTGPHVHFAIHKDGQAVNPFNYLIAGDPPAPVPQVTVPNLVGSTRANALAALQGLTLQLVYDPPQPSNDVPEGRLAVQQPAAGSLADVDTAIHVALSSGPPTPIPTTTTTPSATPVASMNDKARAAVAPTATPTASGGTRAQSATPISPRPPSPTITARR